MMQQIVKCKNAKLLIQQKSTLRANAFEEFYWGFEEGMHGESIGYRVSGIGYRVSSIGYRVSGIGKVLLVTVYLLVG